MTTDTRTAILDAAEGLIKTFGSNGISFQHISDVVSIRKPSIHHHFPTKSDLIRGVLEREREEFFASLDRIVASSANGAKKLKRYIKLFEDTFAEGGGGYVCLFGMLGAELAGLDGSVATVVRGCVLDNLQRLTLILEEGRNDGSVAFEGSSETMADMIFSLLEGAMVVVRAQGESANYFRITKQLQRLLVLK